MSDERREEDASVAGRPARRAAPPPAPRRESPFLARSRVLAVDDELLELRDGERPRKRWLPVAGSAILALLALVNLRALVKRVAA